MTTPHPDTPISGGSVEDMTLGMHVTMTDKGREMFPRSPTRGIVVGGSHLTKDYIIVRRYGRKTAERWHASFWVPAARAAAAQVASSRAAGAEGEGK